MGRREADRGRPDLLGERYRKTSGRPRSRPEGKFLVIANASASMQMEPVGQVLFPSLGDSRAQARQLHNVRGLGEPSEEAWSTGSTSTRSLNVSWPLPSICRPTSGRLKRSLDIASDPFAAAYSFADKDDAWPDRAARARAALRRSLRIGGLTPAGGRGEDEATPSQRRNVSTPASSRPRAYRHEPPCVLGPAARRHPSARRV